MPRPCRRWATRRWSGTCGSWRGSSNEGVTHARTRPNWRLVFGPRDLQRGGQVDSAGSDDTGESDDQVIVFMFVCAMPVRVEELARGLASRIRLCRAHHV